MIKKLYLLLFLCTASQFSKAGEIISIPCHQNLDSTVPIVLLKSTTNKKIAQDFISFCVSEKGKGIIRDKGYTTDLK